MLALLEARLAALAYIVDHLIAAQAPDRRELLAAYCASLDRAAESGSLAVMQEVCAVYERALDSSR